MKLTRSEAKTLGIVAPKKRGKRAVTQGPSAMQRLILEGCKSHGLPEPIFEYEFASPRKWKFDVCWDGEVALEIEGGVWIGGRHVNPSGFLKDAQKYNEAAIRGWLVLRCTPADVESGAIFGTIARALEGE